MTTMQTIPLTQLVPSPANVRKTGAKDGIAELAASIAAHGLLQNLSVRPVEGDRYEVVAGGRRLAALKLLAKEKQIAADYPVPCHALDGEDASEISLAENEMRLPMHPADQFEAFKKLADQGKGPEEIAARFGTTGRIVAQRLRLAGVSPKLIALYKKGEMTLDCLMAFTVAADQRTQEKAWKALPDWARQRPDRIRDVLTEKHVDADSSLAQFVGIEAYEAAGGTVLRDLFDDEGSGWLTDAALVNRLAAETLDRAAETLRGEGWKWVEIVPDLSWEALKGFGRATPERSPPTPTQQREIDALTAEGDTIIDDPRIKSGDGEEPDDEEIANRLWEIEERIAALSEGEATWPEIAKANAGAVIGVGHDGTLDIRRGLIRPEDSAAARKSGTATNTPASTGNKAGKRDRGDLSAALVEDLTAQRTAALRPTLAGSPDIALAAVVHALALPLFYGPFGAESCLSLRLESADLRASAEGIDDSPAMHAFATQHAQWTDRLPENAADLWAWCSEQDVATRLSLLAYCAAHSVDAVQRRHEAARPARSRHAGQLAAALALDMAQWWQPTAQSYLGRVSKKQILDAVAETVSPEAAENLAKLKKDALVAEAEQRLAGSGWLPAVLRTPEPPIADTPTPPAEA